MGSSLRTTLRNSTKLTKNFILRPKKKMAYNFLSRYPYALQDKWDRLDVFSDTLRRSARAKSELGDVLMDGLKTEKDRYYREFVWSMVPPIFPTLLVPTSTTTPPTTLQSM